MSELPPTTTPAPASATHKAVWGLALLSFVLLVVGLIVGLVVLLGLDPVAAADRDPFPSALLLRSTDISGTPRQTEEGPGNAPGAESDPAAKSHWVKFAYSGAVRPQMTILISRYSTSQQAQAGLRVVAETFTFPELSSKGDASIARGERTPDGVQRYLFASVEGRYLVVAFAEAAQGVSAEMTQALFTQQMARVRSALR